MGPSIGIGIDLGGTKIDIAIIGSFGDVIKVKCIATRTNDGPYAIIDDIVNAIDILLADKQDLKISAVGIGIAGQIEKDTGKVYFAPNLKWKNFPLQKELSARLKLPIQVINDVRAAAYAEWLYGSGRNCSNYICMFIGTGIGAGIICGGNLLLGDNNSAGEIGHITIDMHGPKCSCGNWGCFEAIAGGWGIARRAKEVLFYDKAEGHILIESVAGKIDEIQARHVFEAYKQGCLVAEKIIEEVKFALIAGVASVVNSFNPELLALGGGVIKGFPGFIDVIREGLPKRALNATTEKLKIAQAQLIEHAGVIGAAAYAKNTLLTQSSGSI